MRPEGNTAMTPEDVADPMSEMEHPSAEEASWVIELTKDIGPSHSPEKEPWKKHSVYKVPVYMKTLKPKVYNPQMVSIGPYHHGEEHLKMMEQHKHRALLHFTDRLKKPIKEFAVAVEEVIEELMDSYETLDEMWKDRDRFCRLMLLDGCFLLELLQLKVSGFNYYEKDDPIFSLRGVLNTFEYLMPDLLMMENQVPLLLLERLLAVENKRSKEENKNYTNQLVFKFFCHSKEAPKIKPGLHLLDVYRQARVHDLCREQTDRTPLLAVRSASELHGAGIEFWLASSLKDIAFDKGVLSLPTFHIDNTTEVVYLNMIAFERLSFYTALEVTSYVAFMSGLIRSVKDVAFLRSEGVIVTELVGDEDVAKLMQDLAKDVRYDPFSSLCEVRDSLNKHYELGMRKWSRRMREWRKNLKETYFKNPWTFSSLIAAVVLLALTMVQTYYTVVPHYKSD